MRQIAIKSRKAGVLAGIFVFALCFFVPLTAYSYTYQDVQNYLDSLPAIEACKYFTEAYTTNGERGQNVLRTCENVNIKTFHKWLEDGVYFENFIDLPSAYKCDGTLSQVVTNSLYAFNKVRIQTMLCNGQTTEIVQEGGWGGLEEPMFI